MKMDCTTVDYVILIGFSNVRTVRGLPTKAMETVCPALLPYLGPTTESKRSAGVPVAWYRAFYCAFS